MYYWTLACTIAVTAANYKMARFCRMANKLPML